MRSLDRDAQRVLLEAQLAIARDAKLPVVLHVRKAHDEVLSCLKKTPVPGGTVHAFNGSEQQAHHYIDLGFKLGFGGTLTWERSDMVVAQHAGERNSPEYLVHCLHALAEVRGTEPDVIAQRTTSNARDVFGLS